jgi:hypothetical protein
MKPYSYGGGRYSNMDSVYKWAQSKRRAEPGRRTSRNSKHTAAQRHSATNGRGRAAAKREIVRELA